MASCSSPDMNQKSPQLVGQTPELVHELEVLETRVSLLSGSLNTLHGMLSPVLRPYLTPPGGSSEMPPKPEPAMAPLSEFVCNIRSMVDSLDSQMQDIMRHLATGSN